MNLFGTIGLEGVGYMFPKTINIRNMTYHNFDEELTGSELKELFLKPKRVRT
ncbi:hypothetical protein CV093_04560 [Oceanobacillus sp. 143]|uniref:hypothetical protein n=1 Tax=Oceanobacillus zhaokaii TaxID=2052660 RepID=UPI001316C451|nr:hypothetical protein [Oceanobacillus zhaokaii]QGS68173.1 hypothetical protein CV093_04560 [Oceanobacillus sp. 143]